MGLRLSRERAFLKKDVKEAIWKSNENMLELNNDIQLYLLGQISEETLQEKLIKFNEKQVQIFGDWKKEINQKKDDISLERLKDFKEYARNNVETMIERAYNLGFNDSKVKYEKKFLRYKENIFETFVLEKLNNGGVFSQSRFRELFIKEVSNK